MTTPRQPRLAVQDRPYQAQAAALAGEAADHLHPPACLAEGALDEVGVSDAAVVAGWEAQTVP